MVSLRTLGLLPLAALLACNGETALTPPAFVQPIVGSEMANPLTDSVAPYGAVFDDGGDRLVIYDTAEGVTRVVDLSWPQDFTLVDLSARTRSNGLIDVVALGYSSARLQTLVARLDPEAQSGGTLSAAEVTRITGWAAMLGALDEVLIIAGAQFVGSQYGGKSLAAPYWVPLGVRTESGRALVYGLAGTQPVTYSLDVSTHSISGPHAVTAEPDPAAPWRTRRDELYADDALQISADWFVLDSTVPIAPGGAQRPIWRGSDSQLRLQAGAVTSTMELGQSVVAAYPVDRRTPGQPVWVALADGALAALTRQDDGAYAVAPVNRRAGQATAAAQLSDSPPYSNPTLSIASTGSGDGRYFLPSQSILVSYEEPLASFVAPAGFAQGVSVEGSWSRILRVGDHLQRINADVEVTAVEADRAWLSAPWPGGKPTRITAPGRYVAYGRLSGLLGTLAPGESLEFGGIRIQPADGSDAVNTGDRFEFGYETQLRPYRGTGALAVTGWDLPTGRVWTLDRVAGSLASWRSSEGDGLWQIE